ncbi:hypothetical protein AGABI2DRAFT_191156, partial [Agaricus bisporus var. bisporus H97]|uniref:hypothetical protein n=1 Tax=Agaricus bisporus var. bisporus (strain H97 / ATCC MYA-4626 / FGSC 10389) TaxID=936046 RepID=UPI00029F6809
MPCRTRAPRNITSQIMRALSVRHATVWTSSTAFLPANLLPIPITFLSPSFSTRYDIRTNFENAFSGKLAT